MGTIGEWPRQSNHLSRFQEDVLWYTIFTCIAGDGDIALHIQRAIAPDTAAIASGDVARDTASVDGERGSRVILDATAFLGLAACDGDVVADGQRTIVADAAAVVGPAARERAALKGQRSIAKDFDDVAVGIGSSKTYALQRMSVEVDGDGLVVTLAVFQILRQRDVGSEADVRSVGDGRVQCLFGADFGPSDFFFLCPSRRPEGEDGENNE